MKLATLLIIALSHHGYWFGGDPATISLRPAVNGLPNADLVWELGLDGVRLGGGTTALAGDDRETVLRLTLPKVRARVTLHWVYHLVARDTKKEIETGDLPVYLFPTKPSEGLAQRLGSRRILVIDGGDGLTQALENAGLPFTPISAFGKLTFARVDDIVLIGTDAIGKSPFDQAPLAHLAESGASVMVFRQSKQQWLLGYPVARRAAPANLDWKMDHPLLAGFEPQDVRSWIADARSLQVIQLPPDDPSLGIGSYARESTGDEPAAIDTVILTKSIGKGRIVLCQLPLGDWRTDPRSQMLLSNAIEYLLTRPQPTVRPGALPAARTAPVHPNRTNLISSGDMP